MTIRSHKLEKIFLIILLGVATEGVMAEPPGKINPSVVERYRQDEQIKEIRSRQEVEKNVNMSVQADVGAEELITDEVPCFKIRNIKLKPNEAHDFSWLESRINAIYFKNEVCIGIGGVGILKNKMQNFLINEGLVTTGVSIEPQDLNDGEIEFIITAGKVNKIVLGGKGVSQRPLFTALAFKEGELLNIRNLEQTIENIERNPSVEANIQIEPSANPGESDIYISYKQGNRFRGAVSLNDGGSKYSGYLQGAATLFVDRPFNLNDSFYLTISGSLRKSKPTDSRAAIIHYSIPFAFYDFSLTHSESRNNQKVAGAVENYSYLNDQKDTDISLSKVISRGREWKTSVAISGFRRVRRNYIDDTEVEVQRRVIGGWGAEARHTHFLGSGGVLSANVRYDRGTGAFSAIPAPEDEFGEGTARFKIWNVGFAFNQPVPVMGKLFNYQLNVRGQLNKTKLVQADHFVIGGRHTVRGFDGETVLSSERGWLARNDFSMPLHGGQFIPYFAIDHGSVSGPSSNRLVGRSLTGVAVGVKGFAKGVSYNAFIGIPVRKPNGFAKNIRTFGFDIYYNF